MRFIPILCQFQAYKMAGGATKNPLLSNLAYNEENKYFSIIADFFLAKSVLLVSCLHRKFEILAKSHKSLRLH